MRKLIIITNDPNREKSSFIKKLWGPILEESLIVTDITCGKDVPSAIKSANDQMDKSPTDENFVVVLIGDGLKEYIPTMLFRAYVIEIETLIKANISALRRWKYERISARHINDAEEMAIVGIVALVQKAK